MTQTKSIKQRFCLFCGGVRLTKEHIFPDWAKKHREKIAVRTSHDITRFENGALVVKKGKINQTGDPWTHRLRIVCGKCNNNWMSDLQSTAKPIVEPLILGNHVHIDGNSRKILSEWILMTSIVIQQADPRTATLSKQDVEKFYEGRCLPSSTKIFVGILDEPNAFPFWHHAGRNEETGNLFSITAFTIGKSAFALCYGDNIGDVFFAQNISAGSPLFYLDQISPESLHISYNNLNRYKLDMLIIMTKVSIYKYSLQDAIWDGDAEPFIKIYDNLSGPKTGRIN